VNHGLVDGNEVAPAPTSRALTPSAYQALLSALPCPERPGETRNGFVVAFTRFIGLRATELLKAKVPLGSSQSAQFCRLPRLGIDVTQLVIESLKGAAHELSATRSWFHRLSVFGRPMCRSMVLTRCGGTCSFG